MRPLPLSLATLLVSTTSFAGNDDGILLGNDAALVGGAVVATTADGSALWYNPAGLGAVERNSLDLSASAFVLRSYRVPGFLSYANGEASDGNVLEIVSVPSALTLVRKLSASARLALGVFVPQSFDLVLRSKLDVPGETYQSTWILTETETAATYHVGAGLGLRAAPDLWLGASLFGVYRSSVGWAQFWGGLEDGDTTLAFLGSTSLESYESVGLEAGLGVEWRPSPEVRMGAALRSPGLQLLEAYRSLSLTGTAAIAEDGSPIQALEAADEDVLHGNVGILSPPRFKLGVAFGSATRWIALEADIQPAIDNRLVTRETTWNARLGGRAQLSAHLAIGGGLFTDRAPEPDAGDFGTSHVDFYGATAGVELSTAHRLEGRPEERHDVVFTTTLAVRYALGLGQVGGIRFDAAGPDDSIATSRRLDATVHEASLHLGSALEL